MPVAQERGAFASAQPVVHEAPAGSSRTHPAAPASKRSSNRHGAAVGDACAGAQKPSGATVVAHLVVESQVLTSLQVAVVFGTQTPPPGVRPGPNAPLANFTQDSPAAHGAVASQCRPGPTWATHTHPFTRSAICPGAHASVEHESTHTPTDGPNVVVSQTSEDAHGNVEEQRPPSVEVGTGCAAPEAISSPIIGVSESSAIDSIRFTAISCQLASWT
jgi:hypothetical protein